MKFTFINFDKNDNPAPIRVDYLGRDSQNRSIGDIFLNGKKYELRGIINDSDQLDEPELTIICFFKLYLFFGGEKYCSLEKENNLIIPQNICGREMRDQEYWSNEVIIRDTILIIVTESCYMIFNRNGERVFEGSKKYNEDIIVTDNFVKLFFENNCIQEIEITKQS